MRLVINSATYKSYNANNRGNNVGDCVKRGISMAFDMDYNQVSKLLIAQAKKVHSDRWNVTSVFKPVIESLGGKHVGKTTMGAPMKVNDFIDEHPQGTYIMLTGPSPTSRTNHLTCCVDGTLFDSWDSRDQFVQNYFIIEGAEHDFTDLEQYNHEIFYEGVDLITALGEKYIAKYGLTGRFITYPKYSTISNYSITYLAEYVDPAIKTRGNSKDLKIACVFTPTMSPEQAHKKMIDTIKVRMYDFFYAINKTVSENRAGDDLIAASGYSPEVLEHTYLQGGGWMSGTEKRFFNSLPGKIKPFILYINIADIDTYDRYELDMLPIPGDPRFKSDISLNSWGNVRSEDYIQFNGYDSAMLKDMLSDYLNNWERPYEDYEPSERYY